VVVGKLERLDIEKFFKEKYPNETYKFGVQTNATLDFVIDPATNEPINDSPIVDYQNGKTIVYPLYYAENSSLKSRPFYNLNNPVVREYVAQYVLKAQQRCGTNHIFMDNFLPRDYLFYNYSEGKTKKYISSSESMDEQIEQYTLQLLDILKAVKANNSETKFGLNGYSHYRYRSRNKFLDIATMDEHKNSFDTIMVENYFHDDECSIQIDTYYNYTNKKLYDAGKNTLFVVSYFPDASNPKNPFAYKIWLWTHLVGSDKSYLFINPDYSIPMINYTTYSYKLGMPLEEPHKEGDTWYRKYTRGTIVFNTSSGKLDAIRFVEENNCRTGADKNPCNGDVEIGELEAYIDEWYRCSSCVTDLYQAIEAYFS
jgi:hypothetical protein